MASDGAEYRLGMVNTPERGQPCAPEAATFTGELLVDGFTVDVYSSDRYGRQVGEVVTADGDSLNVALAESGLGDDRYFAEFRHENLDLAERLDVAFATAEKPGCLAAAKKQAAKPIPLVSEKPKAKKPADNCHPNYSPCLPQVYDPRLR